jgi:hypothetical protein
LKANVGARAMLTILLAILAPVIVCAALNKYEFGRFD